MNKRFIGSIFIGVLVTGCSWFGREEGVIINPDDDYLEAVQAPSLSIPDDIARIQNSDFIPIPKIPEQVNPRFYPDSPPLPDAIYSNEKRDDVRMQKLGSRNWLIVPEPVTTSWPKLKQFFADNGVGLVLDEPSMGRLDTEWLEISQEDAYRDVIREILKENQAEGILGEGRNQISVKLEQGLRVDSTEIHIRHENDLMSSSENQGAEAFWQVKSDSVDAERDVLNEIGAYIAAKVSEVTVSKVALEIGSVQKSELLRDSNGYPILRLKLDFQRAWATIGQALGNAEADIIELDREGREFIANLPLESLGVEKTGQVLCRLTFSCSGRDRELPVLIQIRANGPDVFDVIIYGQDREQLDAEIAQQISVMLRDFAT
jgi:outer membrane protein assembly factor BamC